MSIRFLQLLLLLVLLLHWQQVDSQEAEPVFKAESDEIELGYCFGVDYIVVYRFEAETGEEQLLANSSAGDMDIRVPADLQHRTHVSDQQQLLGLQIRNLTHSDSGVYRWECWQNYTLVSQHAQRLLVCAEEVQAEKITLREQEGSTELRCNCSSVHVEGTVVHWYHEVYPSYKLTRLPDSSKEVTELGQNEALLLLPNRMLKNNQQFYCAVIQGERCLSFQNMQASYQSKSKDLFVSQGDKVVLKCCSDGDRQHWETPLGGFDANNQSNDHMFISSGDKAEDFSLILPEVSDEHNGDYSCISSSLEVHYTVFVCSNKESKEQVVFEGGSISLECNVSDSDSQRVHWSRITLSGEYEVIHDSNEETAPFQIPEDLRDRVALSKDSSSLMISHLQVQDEGIYSCAVLGGPRFLEDGDSYKDDFDDFGEYTAEDDSTDVPYWDDSCIFKKETVLMLNERKRTDEERGILKQVTRNPDVNTTMKPPANSNGTVYAVAGALAGLLVIGVIVAGIAVKRRRASLSQAHIHSRPNTTKDIKMDMDLGCTDRLTHNDDADA